MRRFMLQIVLSSLCALVAVVARGDAATGTAAGMAACGHYDNRARFMSRTGAVGFVAVLAEACAGAAGTLADAAAPGPLRAAALAFLQRLDAARAVIVDIDTARFATARAATQDRGVGASVRDFRRSYGMVTETGEFLILRNAGVFAMLEAWVAQGADFALIAALPTPATRR